VQNPLLHLALLWGAYFAVHSVLASNRAKSWVTLRWPRKSSGYRLIFNGVSLLLLVPPVWLYSSLSGPWIWRWTGAFAWLANGMALLSIAGAVATLRYYDMDEFLGFHPPTTRGGLIISPFHRFVRHPWYFFVLVLLWTRDMHAPLLVTAVVVTLYLVVGSRLEERKLLVEYGDLYRRYMDSVPGLLPWPSKFMLLEEAEILAAESEPSRRRR
jgi:protein-S-isoprenylcysteine O-methyltransferase Ste14